MKPQTHELSSLLDGEIEYSESARVATGAARDADLRATWEVYALIGDELRREGAAATDLTARVMAGIREEPVVLAPGMLRRERWKRHPFLALAASVAGVAVVGWLALSGQPQSPSLSRNDLVAVRPAPTLAKASAQLVGANAPPPATPNAGRADMREYLLAHQIQAATFRLGDSTEHVRTVSLAGSPVRP